MISLPLVGYVLTAAIRDRLVLALLLLIAVSTSLSVFLGTTAIGEKALFAMVFAAGGLRFAGVIGLVLFVVFHIRRSFESRDVDYLLTRPISRPAFLLSHALAFSLMAILVAACVCAAVFMIAPHKVGDGHLLWAFSIVVEFIIMANAALFFAMVLPGAAACALAVFALYALSRIIGELLGIAGQGYDIPGYQIMAYAMNGISLVVPRLDLMGQTSWLVYGDVAGQTSYWTVLAQGIVYPFLLVGAALVDLVRRQF